jgi:hypothetical protein
MEDTDQCHGRYAGNRLHRADHAPWHCSNFVAVVAGHAHLGIYEHRVLRLKTEIAVQRAHQPTDGHHRRGNQRSADGNLRAQQQSRIVKARTSLTPAQSRI